MASQDITADGNQLIGTAAGSNYCVRSVVVVSQHREVAKAAITGPRAKFTSLLFSFLTGIYRARGAQRVANFY
jgi:hypothetical protein